MTIQMKNISNLNLSLWRKIVLSFLVTLIFFSAIELILSFIFNISTPKYFIEQSDMKQSSGRTFIFRNEHATSFRIPKPQNIFRIIFFGESALNGIPFTPGGGFPRWLEAIANSTQPDQKIEVLNFSVNWINSINIRKLFTPSLDMEPDMVIIFTGNNDSVRYTAINEVEHPFIYKFIDIIKNYSSLFRGISTIIEKIRFSSIQSQIWMGLEKVTEFNDTKIFNDKKRRKRVGRVYRENLRYMIESARDRGVKMVLLSPAVNIREWPPLKSVHYNKPGKDDLYKFNIILEKGRNALDRKEYDLSAESLERTLAIDPTYAEAHYLYAKVLEARNDFENAREHYELAREWDDAALRAPYRFVGITRDLAESLPGAEYIDINQLLGEVSVNGIPGFDIFIDTVHFKRKGNYEVAKILFRELSSRGLISYGKKPVPTFEQLLSNVIVSDNVVAVAYLSEGLNLGFFHWRPELLRNAIKYFDEYDEMVPPETFSNLAKAYLYGWLEEPKNMVNELNEAFLKSPCSSSVTARKYFPSLMEIYQGQVIIRVSRQNKWNDVINEVLSIRKAKKHKTIEPLEFGSIPLSEATYAFIWNDLNQSFKDVSDVVRGVESERERMTLKRDQIKKIDLLSQFPNNFRLKDMSCKRSKNIFVAKSEDSFLIIENIYFDPIIFPTLCIKAKLSSEHISDNYIDIYWSSIKAPNFSEERKISFLWPADGKTRQMKIPLDRIIKILLNRPIKDLRIDFTERPGEVHLQKLELIPEKQKGR